MRRVKGSFTVEAALVLPMILMVFVLAMSGGIRLCKECVDEVVQIRQEKEFDAVQWFYRCKQIGEVIENENRIQ